MWEPQGIFTNFLLNQPTILFGKDVYWGISDYPAAKVAVIHGRSMNSTTKEQIQTVFKKKAVSFHERSWSGEPELNELSATIRELEIVQPDMIIAVGGGSVIDGTKLCRLLYEFPYYKSGVTKIGQLSFKTSFVAVPTTVGSGAEVSSAAVYRNVEEKRKQMVISHDLQPSVIIFDSHNVERTPYRILAASVLDALAHITEGYVSNWSNEIAEMNAELALSIIYREMQKRENRMIDYQALQYAGYLGGIVQNHCLVGVAHAVAHQLTEYGYAHGEAVALLISSVIRLNQSKAEISEKYERLSRHAGMQDTNELIEFVDRILASSAIAERKYELNSLLKKLLSDDIFIKNVIEDKGGRGNPVPISQEMIEKLIGEYL